MTTVKFQFLWLTLGPAEPGVSSLWRNEAEVIEALQKVISKAFTKKATGPNCELNVRVRVHGLSDAGTKKEKCERLASFLVHNGLDFDGV